MNSTTTKKITHIDVVLKDEDLKEAGLYIDGILVRQTSSDASIKDLIKIADKLSAKIQAPLRFCISDDSSKLGSYFAYNQVLCSSNAEWDDVLILFVPNDITSQSRADLASSIADKFLGDVRCGAGYGFEIGANSYFVINNQEPVSHDGFENSFFYDCDGQIDRDRFKEVSVNNWGQICVRSVSCDDIKARYDQEGQINIIGVDESDLLLLTAEYSFQYFISSCIFGGISPKDFFSNYKS